LTTARVSSTIARQMRSFGRAALLLLVAVTLTMAGIPSALDEDRSIPGFCSPDCPLQQDAHSVAVAPAPIRHHRIGAAASQTPGVVPVPVCREAAGSPDAPRAPPLA